VLPIVVDCSQILLKIRTVVLYFGSVDDTAAVNV